MEIKRDRYLKQLIDCKDNGFVKVISGIRRCGKTYLLFNLYYNYLISIGVNENQIIKISLENEENQYLRKMENIKEYINSKMINPKLKYYIFIDEVQNIKSYKIKDTDEIITFHFLLMSLMKKADIYVTGSNSRMLSSDIITDFRGRGFQIKVHPLSFSEFSQHNKRNYHDGELINDYINYGGLPDILKFNNVEQKVQFLNNIFELVYLKDIIERYNIKNDKEVLDSILDLLSSNIGSLTNPTKIANTFNSKKRLNIKSSTIKSYLDIFIDSFLISESKRFDIKGNKYIDTPSKFYFEDMGLRNARLSFRQVEENHIMENIIYNELIIRGFNVDIGVVEQHVKNKDNKYERVKYEIDFIASLGNKKFYIQSAFNVSIEDKKEQEIRGMKKLNDSFKKIVIVRNWLEPKYDDNGIVYIGLENFLLDETITN